MLEKSKGFEGLKAEIIDRNLCSCCGACVSFCEHLELGDDTPVLKEECSLDKEGVIKCSENGTCYDVCPMTETDIEGLEGMFFDSECVKDEYLGIYRKLIAGRTQIEGQDGGMVTSMLVAGVEKGLFDCTIVAEREDGYNAVPKITEDVEEIKRAKGTRYVQCPYGIKNRGSSEKREKILLASAEVNKEEIRRIVRFKRSKVKDRI